MARYWDVDYEYVGYDQSWDDMQQMLEEAGYEIVPFSEKADVYVINTCSVTNMADRKSRQMLHRAKKAESGCGCCCCRMLCTDQRE